MAKFLISAFADEADPGLDGQIQALHRNGLHYIEPRSIGKNLVEMTDEELYAIRERLDKENIGVSSLGSPVGKYDITKEFEPHLATFRRALSVCRILGTPRMRMFSFFIPEGQYKTYREEVLRRLDVLVNEADQAGVMLCHENESEIYGQNPQEVSDLLTSLPKLKGVFDAANFVRHQLDPVKGFEATLPNLEYVHIKDTIMETGEMVPVGEGDGHYREILQRVDQMTDRTVFLTLEPHLFSFDAYKSIDKLTLKIAHQYADANEAFDTAVAALKTMLKEIGFSEKENGLWRK